MLKRGLFYTLLSAIVFGFLASSCADLGSSNTAWYLFGARLPYANYVNYYGYITPSIKPDGQTKGKDAWYLYFWVPAVIDEVGVAMRSPAPNGPEEGDFKHPAFDENFGKDATAFFDTYLALERMDIIEPEKIKDGGNAISLLQTNDDSGELPANPSGSRYNSLLRHESEASDPLKALVRGVYRIAFTSFRGNVTGSYLAEVGTNVPGVKIAASLEELHALVNAPE